MSVYVNNGQITRTTDPLNNKFGDNETIMKSIFNALIAISLCSIVVCGCATNWATANKPVTFLPDVVQALETTTTLPITLTDEQSSELLESLGGPVRREFTSKDLNPDILASWHVARFGSPAPNCITFVRLPKNNGQYYAYIAYTPDGQLFSAGGGRKESSTPPWKQ